MKLRKSTFDYKIVFPGCVLGILGKSVVLSRGNGYKLGRLYFGKVDRGVKR